MFASRVAISLALASLLVPDLAAGGQNDPATPLLALVRDVCLKPKHDLEQATAAVLASMPLKPIEKSQNEDGVHWQAQGEPAPYGVVYLLISALGGSKANGLIANVVGDSDAFEKELRAMADVKLSERQRDEVSHPSLKVWRLTGGSTDGTLALELDSHVLQLRDGLESNSYGVTCRSTAKN